MNQRIFVIFIGLFFSFFHGCIPLNNVHSIDLYELKEGKPRARKVSKRYTKFKISNHSSVTIAIKYLDTKFKVFKHKNIAYASKKLFLDVDINFNLEFEFSSKTEQYLDLINLFSRNAKAANNQIYDDDSDDIVQEGSDFNFISISIKDDAGIDYLAQNSELRNRLISYLKLLISDYNVYRKSINFLNEE